MDFNIEANNWDNERRVSRAKIIANEIIRPIHIEGHFRAMEFGCGSLVVKKI
jgi:hypothetical protein